jgi:hypothetical protein
MGAGGLVQPLIKKLKRSIGIEDPTTLDIGLEYDQARHIRISL